MECWFEILICMKDQLVQNLYHDRVLLKNYWTLSTKWTVTDDFEKTSEKE